MTWTDLTATGIGGDGVEFRLVAEGCPVEFVTDGIERGPTYGANVLPAPGAVAWTGGAGGTVTSGQPDPLGGTSAWRIEDDSGAGDESGVTSAAAYVGGTAVRCEAQIKRDGAALNFAAIKLQVGGASVPGGILLHLGTGATALQSGGSYSGVECTEIDGWWRLRFTHPGAAGATTAIRVWPAIGLASAFPSATVGATGSCTVYAPSIRPADGRRRVHGLSREVGFTESAYLAAAKIDVGITPARITETPGADLDAATEAFTAEPVAVADLVASLSESATSAEVRSAAGLTVGGYYHVSTEVIRVDAIVGQILTIARGQWGTTPQAHPVEATDGTPTIRRIRSAPTTWVNRRVWLYAHGATELDPLDEGRVIWRGVIASDPQLEGGDATTWILNLGSRWQLLDQEIGAGNDKTRRLAGVYYPGDRAFGVSVWRTPDAYPDSGFDGSVSLAIAGYFGSTPGLGANEAWAQHVADTLNAHSTIASWGVEFIGVVESDGRWNLHVRIPAPARYIGVLMGSAVDGTSNPRLRAVGNPNGYEIVGPVVAGGVYAVNWRTEDSQGIPAHELRRVPRSNNGDPGELEATDLTERLANSRRDVYLDSVRGLEPGATLTFSQHADSSGEDRGPAAAPIASVDPATGRVGLYGTAPVLSVGAHAQEITVATRLSPLSGSTLAELRDDLIADAPALANAGARPFVTADDLADWHAVIDPIVANNRALYDKRQYVYHQGVRLTEILEQEAAFYGCFFRLDAEGKIALAPLTFDTQPVRVGHRLSDEDGSILFVDGFGQLTSGDDGNVNVIEYGTRYDPSEDKHRGYVRPRSVEGMSEARKERAIEIKPKSHAYAYRVEIDVARALELAAPIFAFFGGRIHHYTFAVPLLRFGVLVGDKVSITHSALPWGGARRMNAESAGLSDVLGIVVGRDWSDIASGVGRLTVLVSSAMTEVSGYSPSGWVESASGAGTAWTLTLAASHYAPAGSADASYFRVGDRVLVYEWDAASPTQRTGTVSSVTGNDVAVTLDSSWLGTGGAAYVLTYMDDAYDSAMRDGQLTDYAWIAEYTGRRAVPGGDAPARVFAP